MKKIIVLWILMLALLLISGCGREKDTPTKATTVPTMETAVTKVLHETIEETVTETEMEPDPQIDETEETMTATQPTEVYNPTQIQQTTEEMKATETTPLSTQETIIAPENPEDGLGWG